jgi:hypothetical protein
VKLLDAAFLYVAVIVTRKYKRKWKAETLLKNKRKINMNKRCSTINDILNFPPRRPGFESGSGQVGFVVDKVALGHVFSEYFDFPCQSSLH